MEKNTPPTQGDLAQLIHGFPVMVCALSTDGLIKVWNQECERITGYLAREVTGSTTAVGQIFTSADVSVLLVGWDESVSVHPYRTWEGEITVKGGSSKYICLCYRFRRDFFVEGPHIWCIGLDITGQTHAYHTLRREQERLSLAVLAAGIGFWDWSAATNEVFYSPECFALAGFTPMEFVPSYEKWLELAHPEDRSRIQSRVFECVHGNNPDFMVEFRIKGQDRQYRWLFTQGKVFDRQADGMATRLTGVVFDRDARKRTEKDLKNALAKVEELKKDLEEENLQLKQELQGSFKFDDIISVSETYRRVLRQVEQVAATDTTVLITGETGTGKELVARSVYRLSKRAGRPLVKVNCAALPQSLIESELFGHEKGAFTGAYAKKIGRFEQADGGTLFLDEIGELPLELQVKLLRVLQEGEFEPLGSNHTRKVDVRIIAATNRNLEEAVAHGEFRADLYYRLNVFPLVNPPLRERTEDIPLLVRYFINKYAAKTNKKITSVSKKTLHLLETYPWPGNIRELENIIERAVVLSHGPKLEIAALQENSIPATPQTLNPESGFETLAEHERKHIIAALALTHGRVTGANGAGKLLGMNDKTLQSRMRKLGLSRQPNFG